MRRFLTFVFWLLAFLSIFPLYTRFKAQAGPVPPGVYLGGVEMGALKDPTQIEAHLNGLYLQPIAVHFADRRLVLRPDEIDFQIDAAAMIREAGQYLHGGPFMDIALRKLLGWEQRRRDVSVRYTYDPDRLKAWLQEVAEAYNSEPQPPRVLPPNWVWSDGLAADRSLPAGFVGNYYRDWLWVLGQPGYTLDQVASEQAVLEAFLQPQERTARLVLEETPPPPPSMQALAQVLDSHLSDFPGFAAIYVQDVSSGEEATVDVDVAFSGMSTLKIAIVSTVFQRADGVEDVDLGQWIDHALGESSNFAANLLLRWLGDGDIFLGGRRVTEFMRALDYPNTFIQTGYDDKRPVAEIPTAANQRTDWNTDPDPHLQSTPAEMGRLLAEVYHCSLGEGRLLETFSTTLTPEECGYILFYMSHDEFPELLWSGLPRPRSIWIVHKHGFANESHSDVALIWGPTGPYAISVFLFRRGWMDWKTSNGTMKELSRIVWNFFEFKRKQEGGEAGSPPILAPPPNYVPVNTYSSQAATRSGLGTP